MRLLITLLVALMVGSVQAAPAAPPAEVAEPIVRRIQATFTWEVLEGGAWKPQDSETVTLHTGAWWTWDASPKASKARSVKFVVASLWSERHPDKILVRADQSVDGSGGKSLPLSFSVTMKKDDEHVWGLTDANGTVGQRLRVKFKETTPPPLPVPILKAS